MAFLRKGFLKSVHRRNELRSGVDLSVAAIFTFLLLVMFMVLPQPERGVHIDVVEARHIHYLPGAVRDDAIKIDLTSEGSVYFGHSKVRPENLPDMIRDAVRHGAEKRIYLEVDASASYRDVNALLPRIQESGIHDVSLIADSPPSVATPSSLPAR